MKYKVYTEEDEEIYFEDEVEAIEYVEPFICDDCMLEYFDEYKHLPLHLEELLSTRCGAEIFIEKGLW